MPRASAEITTASGDETLVRRDEALHTRLPLPQLTHRDTQASSGGTFASSSSSSKDEPVRRDGAAGGNDRAATHEGDGDTSYPPSAGAIDTRNARAYTHSSSRLRRTLRWIAGPHPPTELTIRHYKWWPFERVERGWRRITDRVAWREPGEERPSRPQWLERGMSGQVAYDLEGFSPNPMALPSAKHRLSGAQSSPVTAWRQWFIREWHTNRLHWLLLFITYVGWLLGFSFIVKDIWSDASVQDTTGGNSTEPVFFGCTDTYWVQNARCGLNGQDCSPFSSNTSVAFRCPAGCASTHLGAARAIGTELPNFVPLVVGGGDASLGMYRADSWVCSAAIHAGLVSEDKGGCGKVWQAGAYSDYIASDANGISSVGFNSSFPSSFFFDRGVQTSKCTDERHRVYIFDVILSAFTSLVLQPKMIVWFYTLVCLGFWHINYASEPRAFPPTPGGPMGDFLPTLFVGYAIWRLTFRFVLPAFEWLPLERTIWILGPFWIGVLLNVVFANVPLQRLVASDLQSQPGALTALIIIIVVVIVIAINQIRVIRKVGYLPKYLTLTLVGGVLLGLLAAVPETGLRLHHYIIALILLPFTAFETRLSLIYASFLLGMFLNGVGRWGYDGIVQDISTIRGDATMGSDLPSFIGGSNWTGVDSTTRTGWIYWDPLPDIGGYDGFDLIVDDVLRLSSTSATRYNLAEIWNHFQPVDSQTGQVNNLTYYPSADINATISRQPHYLRLAYTSQGSAGDFTAAATAYFNGTWVDYDREQAT